MLLEVGIHKSHQRRTANWHPDVMALFNNIYVALQWASADMDRIYTGLGAVSGSIPLGRSL